MQVVADTSFLVALMNPRDMWHARAVALNAALLTADATVSLFDCVIAEAISTAVRHLHEKGYASQVGKLFLWLNEHVHDESITWVLPDVPRLYTAVMDLIRATNGQLNFNDALLALACRERCIAAIATFDSDFRQIAWLRCLASPADVTQAIS